MSDLEERNITDSEYREIFHTMSKESLIELIIKNKREIRRSRIHFSGIDYKKKYFELYEKIAKMLIENKRNKKPYTPSELLFKWDELRSID